MPKLIKNGQIVDDDYHRINTNEELLPGNILVDLETLTHRTESVLKHPGKKGVLLEPHQPPELILPWLAELDLVALEFPQFTDGRGFSYAYLLRTRYGYQGEIRAMGDILKDTLFYLKQCGVDSYVLRADKNVEDALEALNTFTTPYQASVRNEAIYRSVRR